MSAYYSVEIDVIGIKPKNDPSGNNNEPCQNATPCLCELTLFDTTSGVNIPLARFRRSCTLSLPTDSGQHYLIRMRTPFAIDTGVILEARLRREKSFPRCNLSSESFSAHIALRPSPGYAFPPPLDDKSCEFYTFDEPNSNCIEDWKNLFQPSTCDLTTAILDFPVVPVDAVVQISHLDVVMLSSEGDLGKLNFNFEFKISWIPEWEVEKIVGERRGRRGRRGRKFLVKWIGYKKCTWEPERNLRNAPRAVAQWLARSQKT